MDFFMLFMISYILIGLLISISLLCILLYAGKLEYNRPVYLLFILCVTISYGFVICMLIHELLKSFWNNAKIEYNKRYGSNEN